MGPGYPLNQRSGLKFCVRKRLGGPYYRGPCNRLGGLGSNRPQNHSNYSEKICVDITNYNRKYNDAFRDRPDHEKILLACVYALISTFGVCGNGLVIFAMLKCPELRTLRNYFILNLACSDFLMCVITAPATLYTVMNVFWPFGDITCRMIASSQGVNIFVSTLTLAAIGLDRYLLIIFPVRFRSNKAVIVVCFIFVWLVSFLFAFPYFFATSAVSAPGKPFTSSEFRDNSHLCQIAIPKICLETGWETLALGRTTYSLLCFMIQYLVPLLVLSLLYCQIGLKLYRRSRSDFARSANSERQRLEQSRQRRTIILLSCLVATFATCWLPLNLYNTLSNFDLIQLSMRSGFVYCHLIAMTTACINPILYGVLNENFKTAYSQMFIKMKNKVASCTCRQRHGSSRQQGARGKMNCSPTCAAEKECTHMDLL